jgi:hypothetical protein
VADQNDTENFTQDSRTVQAQLPSTLQVTDVFTSTVGSNNAPQDIVAAINSGQLLVNYIGHGSEEQWSGENLFDTTKVPSLTNSSRLPVFLIMDCLNGFFQDVYAQPLAVTLLLAPNGGGVAAVASSGLNQAPPQTELDKLIVENALNSARPTLGESILKAKSLIGDPVVRKTYILFGDPAMQIKLPSPARSTARRRPTPGSEHGDDELCENALREDATQIFMCGTPWHDEAAFTLPDRAPLQQTFILEHGCGNVITRLSRSQMVAELFARSFVPFHRHEYVDSALSFLERVADSVACCRYAFEPDEGAVDRILNFHD